MARDLLVYLCGEPAVRYDFEPAANYHILLGDIGSEVFLHQLLYGKVWRIRYFEHYLDRDSGLVQRSIAVFNGHYGVPGCEYPMAINGFRLRVNVDWVHVLLCLRSQNVWPLWLLIRRGIPLGSLVEHFKWLSGIQAEMLQVYKMSLLLVSTIYSELSQYDKQRYDMLNEYICSLNVQVFDYSDSSLLELERKVE